MKEINGKSVSLTIAVPRIINTCGSHIFEIKFADLSWYSRA